jgi:hypothetical protein
MKALRESIKYWSIGNVCGFSIPLKKKEGKFVYLYLNNVYICKEVE